MGSDIVLGRSTRRLALVIGCTGRVRHRMLLEILRDTDLRIQVDDLMTRECKWQPQGEMSVKLLSAQLLYAMFVLHHQHCDIFNPVPWLACANDKNMLCMPGAQTPDNPKHAAAVAC